MKEIPWDVTIATEELERLRLSNGVLGGFELILKMVLYTLALAKVLVIKVNLLTIMLKVNYQVIGNGKLIKH